MATNVNELIFIKRVKKKPHEHAHGGAWKIAYADFAAAMMAFFLLMWLLNATTEDQRTAISNYFAPASVSKSTSGAGGVLGGRTLDSEGAMTSNTSSPGLILGIRVPELGSADGDSDEESSEEDGAFFQRGPVAAHEFGDADGSHMGTLDAHEFEQGGGSHLGTLKKNDAKDAKGEFLARADEKSEPGAKPGVSKLVGPKQGAGDSQRQFARREQKRFDNSAAVLKNLINQGLKLQAYKDNIKIEQIGAGLRIQLLDTHKTEMFPLGSAEMMEKTSEIMAKIAESIKKLPNKIAIVGHTDATPYRAGSGYSNWELFAVRAHASRRALIAAGLPEERLATVTGKAATDSLNKADPEAPSNRRISILLLRESAPAKPLGRGPSVTQSSPYSDYQAPVPARPAAPVVTPVPEPAVEADGAGGDIDPLEESIDREERIEEPTVETPVESTEAQEPEADTEAPPPEEFAPAPEEELIDSDLWQRL